MKTYMAHVENVERKWYVVDAEGIALGRLASKVAAVPYDVVNTQEAAELAKGNPDFFGIKL